MAEDRLNKAIKGLKNEYADPKEVAAAGMRVRETLGDSEAPLCAEFRSEFQGYLDGGLAPNRRLLMEDHLSRCAGCRARLAGMKGERKPIPMRPRRMASWTKWTSWAAAAAVVLAMLYLGRGRIDDLLAPGGPRATVASVAGGLYLVPEGVLKPGSAIAENAVVRSGAGARAVLRLADGSLVDVNEGTELSVHAAWSGQTIRLQRGDIIVRAAKQRRGHLRVQTRDSLASVRGTIFAVSAGLNGSVVSVVEGSVEVAQTGNNVMLRPGEQAASNPALTGSVESAVAWSPDAETYLGIMASLGKVQRGLAALPSPMLRTQSALLEYIPASTIMYGALPNLSQTVDQAMFLADQQSAENPAFNQWWNSGPGDELRRLVGRIQTVTPLLGDEIVYGMCAGDAKPVHMRPMLLAEVRAGRRAELKEELDALNVQLGRSLHYSLTDAILAVSDSDPNLEWLIGHMGQGGSALFAQEIAARYRAGAAWLFGVDMDSILTLTGGDKNEFVGAQQLKHLFLTQRGSQATEENEMSVSFKGPRTGLSSFLASAGSGGAAEYISRDAVAAVYVATREPEQLFNEMISLLSRSPSSSRILSDPKGVLVLAHDFAASFGTESAMSLEGVSVNGPVWSMAALVHQPSTLDRFVRRLVDSVNAEFREARIERQMTVSQEIVDGRTWNTIELSPASITWTYDQGYLVAGSDRGAVSRALATRNGGLPLVWSSEFQGQLTPSAGLHPSGFVWLNTRGAFQGIASLAPNPALRQLAEQKDPVLVLFSGTTEQIKAVSRTRVTGLITNLVLAQGMGSSGRGAMQPMQQRRQEVHTKQTE